MLKLCPSNHQERLAEHLAAIPSEPLRDPFAAEIVVTPTLGMVQSLSLQLARDHGVAANPRSAAGRAPLPRASRHDHPQRLRSSVAAELKLV